LRSPIGPDYRRRVRREDCDVLIVGAGPAGAAAGICLAGAGLSVVAVDRATFPRDKTCGDALSNAGVDLVGALGAGEALAAAPHAIVRSGAAILPDGTRIVRSYGERPGLIVARRVLDDLLRTRMQDAGVRLVEGQAIRGLQRVGPAEVLASGPGFSGHARTVIAADGPGSVAWPALGEPYPRGPRLAVAATVYLKNAEPAEPDCAEHYFERDLPCGYGWLFPPVEGLANVGVYQRSDYYHRSGRHVRELLKDFLARHPERFAGAEPAGPVRTWALPLSLRAWPVAGGPGIVVCGDAAQAIDPLSGEGIWQALKTGTLAAECVREALARRGAVDAAAIRSYRLACARAIAWPSLVKASIQEGMRVLVGRGWDRSAMVQRALQWGYGSGRGEFSKVADAQ
jgi:geranylgeranyl reductase family protein